jgi:RNA polymerase sigma-70 factor, ECF subfamily
MTLQEHPAEPWRAAIQAALPDQHDARAALIARWPTLWHTTLTAHPELSYPQEALAGEVARHLSDALEAGKLAAAWLDNLLVEDLYLAGACVLGDTRALRTFEARYGDHLLGLARRHQQDASRVDELVQALREKLLVAAPGRPAKLSAFSGQGALRMWLQITATRTFIDIGRANARHEPEELVEPSALFERLADEAQDTELDYLKHTYRAAFKTAFAAAAAALTPRQRNLLGQNILGELNIDQLGAMYGVHRATAARWLQDARVQLATNTRAQLATQLRIAPDEVASIMNLIQSRVSLSLSRLLDPRDQPQP